MNDKQAESSSFGYFSTFAVISEHHDRLRGRKTGKTSVSERIRNFRNLCTAIPQLPQLEHSNLSLVEGLLTRVVSQNLTSKTALSTEIVNFDAYLNCFYEKEAP